VYFWVDILLNFFTSFTDDDRNVVRDLRKIGKRYLSSWFAIDFLSGALPPLPSVTAQTPGVWRDPSAHTRGGVVSSDAAGPRAARHGGTHAMLVLHRRLRRHRQLVVVIRAVRQGVQNAQV
jgi:hypothetical protein